MEDRAATFSDRRAGAMNGASRRRTAHDERITPSRRSEERSMKRMGVAPVGDMFAPLRALLTSRSSHARPHLRIPRAPKTNEDRRREIPNFRDDTAGHCKTRSADFVLSTMRKETGLLAPTRRRYHSASGGIANNQCQIIGAARHRLPAQP